MDKGTQKEKRQTGVNTYECNLVDHGGSFVVENVKVGLFKSRVSYSAKLCLSSLMVAFLEQSNEIQPKENMSLRFWIKNEVVLRSGEWRS